MPFAAGFGKPIGPAFPAGWPHLVRQPDWDHCWPGLPNSAGGPVLRTFWSLAEGPVKVVLSVLNKQFKAAPGFNVVTSRPCVVSMRAHCA